MVRILPTRLKSTSSITTSRSNSPLRSGKMDSLSPNKDNGLALKVAAIKVGPATSCHQLVALVELTHQFGL